MKRKFSVLALTVLTAVGLLSVSGCDALSPDGSGMGTVRVLLTDAPFPFDLVSAANVTIVRVDLVGQQAAEDTTGEARDGVYTVTSETLDFNLLELRDGVTALLGEIEIPAGTYSQARLIVQDASVDLIDGRTFKMKIPSGAQTGIKVALPGFEVTEGSVSELTLDFMVDKSFVVQGNPATPAGIKGFLFKPVIKPLGLPASGDDSGDGEDDGSGDDDGGSDDGSGDDDGGSDDNG